MRFVKVTVISPAVASGLVTIPVVLLTAGLLELHAIVVPLLPEVGKLKLFVTASQFSPSAKSIVKFAKSKYTASATV